MITFSYLSYFRKLVLNPLPNHKNFGCHQAEGICSRQNKCHSYIQYVFDSVGNMIRKGENAGYPHFLFLLEAFS